MGCTRMCGMHHMYTLVCAGQRAEVNVSVFLHHSLASKIGFLTEAGAVKYAFTPWCEMCHCDWINKELNGQ